MRRAISVLSAVVLSLGTGTTASLAVTINNAGFETPPFPPYPGYSSSIPDWTGAAGVNPTDIGQAPFLNGLAPPEGTHTGFQQGSGTLSQDISGFEIGKQYVLQYFEDERGLAGAMARLEVRLGGQTIVPTHNVTRTPQFRQVVSQPLTATATTHTLQVIHPGGGVGDNTALFDGFVIERAGIKNPSFEEGPVNPYPGYGTINDWTRVHPPGNSGTNDASGPFLNGLPIPDGDWIAFIQGGGTLRQDVSGFQIGKQYILQLAENERGMAGAVARLQVNMDGTTIVPLHDVTRTPQFQTAVSAPFTATSFTQTLELIHPGGGTGDNTVLLDNLVISPAGVPFIKNAGFEDGPVNPYPGYGRINSWYTTGGGGTNDASGPFVNGLPIPYGDRVGFFQGSGSASQTVVGLEAGKQYILQYFENERTGADRIARLQVNLDGATIVPVHDVTRTSQFRTVVSDTFTATGTSATLEVIHPGGGTGDNTALFDQFIITEAGVPFVKNASFEEGPVNASPGYGRINGWNRTNIAGNSGTNDASGPFVNGLPIPDGQWVGFIQRTGNVSQTVAGLEPGKQYVVQYYQDERGSSTDPVTTASVDVDGVNVVRPVEVIRTPQFRRVVSRPFTATGTSAVLEISATDTQADNTLLFDAVSVRPIGALLFQDNFDLPNVHDPPAPHLPAGSYDINVGLGGRQAGLFAGTRYVETAHSAAGAPGDLASQVDFAGVPSLGVPAVPDALFLGADASQGADYTAVSPNRNFAFGSINVGRMTFEFDVDPFLPGSTTGDNWAGFRFGDDAPFQRIDAAGDGFGILFRDGGEFQAFDGNTSVASGAAFTGPGFHAIRIDVETEAFDGSPATILAFADSSDTPFLTYSKPGGFTDNFVTLGGYSGAGQMLHAFDNLMIYTAAVPEPSTLVLLGISLAGLAAFGRRRR